MLIASAIQATTYQIANQTAFNAFDFSSVIAGDNVLFAKGQTFKGSITLSNSGTSGNPITFGAYGTGANPIITGFTTVTAWTNLGSNIWESTNAISTLSKCNMVTINGVNTAMGRWPNSDETWGGYVPFQSHSGSTSITSSSLSGTPSWTGAEVVVRTSAWTIDRRVITSQSSGTISWTTNTSFEWNADGYGFFIQNDVRTLDKQNEWYYNPTTKKIRIYSASQPVNVNVASVDYLLIADYNYITIDGINFTGANTNAIYRSAEPRMWLTVQNCSISFSGSLKMDLQKKGYMMQFQKQLIQTHINDRQ